MSRRLFRWASAGRCILVLACHRRARRRWWTDELEGPRVSRSADNGRPGGSAAIHLAVIDGIYSMTGGELPNQAKNFVHQAVHPGLLIAGLNCVSTDAVATAVLGFDPMADRGRRLLKPATAP